jgi:Predicted membrane protein (DUF2339)
MEIPKQIEALMRKLETLAQHSTDFQNDLNNLREEVRLLKNALEKSQQHENPIVEEPKTSIEQPIRRNPPISAFGVEPKPKFQQPVSPPKVEIRSEPFTPPVHDAILKDSESSSELPSDLEKFIGENLSNKIGILIIVLGISIGVKYAIDHNMVTPLMRILFGYLMGCGMLAVSARLYNQYKDLSAVILSGGLATIYFVTYAAYDFYSLIPQGIAFAVMVVMTISAVAAALYYDLQTIAIGGLIGAYCVPFLLGNNSDRPGILFSYMLIINSGILYIAFKKDWRLTNFLAFGLSWLIFLSWFGMRYHADTHFGVGFSFATLFFFLFQATFLAYKFLRDEPFSIKSIALLTANAFIFYGVGYALLSGQPTGKHLLGFFTLLNAGIHFGISMMIYRRSLADDKLFANISGLFLVFLTLAIFVQLDGYWITMGWAIEMALLFWIGRTKGVSVYETFSYGVMFLTVCSHLLNMVEGYHNFILDQIHLSPIANMYFLTTLMVIGGFISIYKTHQKEQLGINRDENGVFRENFKDILVGIIAVLTYFLFYNEISAYFEQQAVSFGEKSVHISRFKSIWLINYTLLFASVSNYINLKKYKNFLYAQACTGIIVISMFVFLTMGLKALDEIKNAYQPADANYLYSMLGFKVRFISYGLIVGLIYHLNENRKAFFNTDFIKNSLVGMVVLLGYFFFHSEIAHVFDQQYADSDSKDGNILNFKTIWLVNYTLLFATALNYINLKKYKNVLYAHVGMGLMCVSLFIFLTMGLLTLVAIRDIYQNPPPNTSHSILGLTVRYISFALVAGLIYCLNENRKQFLDTPQINVWYDLLLHGTILWCVSSEMIYWLSFYAYHDTYKLVLSILFGIYALILIVLGIRDPKKHLRLAAIGLFGFTLLKLFLYDLAHLGTIQKTIVMISLGVLLLIISFLYNKYAKKRLDNGN